MISVVLALGLALLALHGHAVCLRPAPYGPGDPPGNPYYLVTYEFAPGHYRPVRCRS